MTFWWILCHVLQIAANLVALGAGIWWVVAVLWPNAVRSWTQQSKHTKQSQQLGGSGAVIHTDEPDHWSDRTQALTVDEVRAGQVIAKLPNPNPGEGGGWTQDVTVIATAHGRIYTPQGVQDTVFIWTSKDRLLMKTPKKWRLLTELPISSHESRLLLEERESLLRDVRAGRREVDSKIENFRGCSWVIDGAYGRNEGRNPGQSTIECTSVLDNLSEFEDDVPNLMLRRNEPVSYFDLRAYWKGGDPSFKDRVMVVIWAEEGSDAVVYVGKELSEADVMEMVVA